MNTSQQEDMEDRCAGLSEMVERVARAQKVALLEITGGTLQDHLFLAMANASIRAMRDPTGAMLDAGDAADDGSDARAPALWHWHRMIDAALSPAQRSSNPQQENER